MIKIVKDASKHNRILVLGFVVNMFSVGVLSAESFRNAHLLDPNDNSVPVDIVADEKHDDLDAELPASESSKLSPHEILERASKDLLSIIDDSERTLNERLEALATFRRIDKDPAVWSSGFKILTELEFSLAESEMTLFEADPPRTEVLSAAILTYRVRSYLEDLKDDLGRSFDSRENHRTFLLNLLTETKNLQIIDSIVRLFITRSPRFSLSVEECIALLKTFLVSYRDSLKNPKDKGFYVLKTFDDEHWTPELYNLKDSVERRVMNSEGQFLFSTWDLLMTFVKRQTDSSELSLWREFQSQLTEEEIKLLKSLVMLSKLKEPDVT